MNLTMDIYIYSCLSVCLHPINVKTAEPIGPKFCVGPYMTPGKFYERSKYQNLPQTKLDFHLI